MGDRGPTDAHHSRTLAKIAQFESLAAAVRSARPLDGVIELVIRQIADLVPADATAVWLYDADNDVWYIGGTRGFSRRTSQLSFKSNQTLHAKVGDEGEVVTNLKSVGFRRVYPEHDLIQCALYAPMKIAGRRVGLIALYRNTEESFTEDDLRFVRTVGSQLGMAISFAALEARAQRAAALDERARLGADLHDGVLQILSSVRVYARELRASLEPFGTIVDADRVEGVIAALDMLDGCVDDGSEEIAMAIHNLRRPNATWEIRQHLQLTESRLRQAGMVTTLVCEIEDIDPEVSDVLGWIVREAGSNILRHSRARSVTIRAEAVGSDIELVVADDGIGEGDCAPQSGGPGGVWDDRHLGQRIMAERARDVGGTLSVSHGKDGTTVHARMPAVPLPAVDRRD
jgi:signal transduction histidine kinase